jgi:hypothetical protein
MECHFVQNKYIYFCIEENNNRTYWYLKQFFLVTDFLKFVGPSGQKITKTGNTAKYAGPGVRQKILFVYFVLHRKSEMQLVCRNDHGQLGIRFCYKWHLLPLAPTNFKKSGSGGLPFCNVFTLLIVNKYVGFHFNAHHSLYWENCIFRKKMQVKKGK